MLETARSILKTLHDSGYDAYLVGGCVRDMLLSKEPHDIDIATNATPDKVRHILHGARLTGESFGVSRVWRNGFEFEVATFRTDSDTSDGRRPTSVTFVPDLLHDLQRRDFTINAMAMDINGNLIDPLNGRADLLNGLIRFVGDPAKRIQEDRLRVLRGIRFASTLGLTIEANTYNAMHGVSLDRLGFERINTEFCKILLSERPGYGIIALADLGLLGHISPKTIPCIGFQQRSPYHSKDVFGHMLDVLNNTPPDLISRLAAFYHDIGKPGSFSLDENGRGRFFGHHELSSDICGAELRRLRFTNEEVLRVKKLVHYHMDTYENVKHTSAKRLINKIGVEDLERLFYLQRADSISSLDSEKRLNNISAMRNCCKEVLDAQLPISLKDLVINGKDLLPLGYSGKDVGKKLLELLDLVIEHPELNTKEELLKRCR